MPEEEEYRGRGDWQLLRHDQEMQAKTLGELVTHQREMADDITEIKKELAVRAEVQRHISGRLDKIESTLTRLNWLLITAIVVAAANFMIRGGFIGPIPPV